MKAVRQIEKKAGSDKERQFDIEGKRQTEINSKTDSET